VKRLLRVTYLSAAIMGLLGGILAISMGDTSEFFAWFTAVAMAGAGFIREAELEEK